MPWAFRIYVMRFAHLAAHRSERWEIRMSVMRFAHVSSRPAAKWQNRMLEPPPLTRRR
jgi:hypothetical protein